MKKLAMTLITLAMTGPVHGHDYLGMEPKIIKESDIETVVQSVEDAEGNANEQIIKILLGTEDTAGQFTLFSDVFPSKGSMVKPHIHNWHDEAFYVIRGSFEVTNGDMGTQVVGPNTAVFSPRGQLHAWKSLEDDSKMLIFYTPGGWEHFFEAVKKLSPEQMKDGAFMKGFFESYDEYFQ